MTAAAGGVDVAAAAVDVVEARIVLKSVRKPKPAQRRPSRSRPNRASLMVAMTVAAPIVIATAKYWRGRILSANASLHAATVTVLVKSPMR
jgi:hypothetical protein